MMRIAHRHTAVVQSPTLTRGSPLCPRAFTRKTLASRSERAGSPPAHPCHPFRFLFFSFFRLPHPPPPLSLSSSRLYLPVTRLVTEARFVSLSPSGDPHGRPRVSVCSLRMYRLRVKKAPRTRPVSSVHRRACESSARVSENAKRATHVSSRRAASAICLCGRSARRLVRRALIRVEAAKTLLLSRLISLRRSKPGSALAA